MASFKQAHAALRDYTERFNRLALECANEGRNEIGLERQDALGSYPKDIPYQWKRRMPDVISLSPQTILRHRAHLDQTDSTYCQVAIDGTHRYLCPIGYGTQYPGLTRQEIDGR